MMTMTMMMAVSTHITYKGGIICDDDRRHEHDCDFGPGRSTHDDDDDDDVDDGGRRQLTLLVEDGS
eukprot:8960479-Karenia_brevis.AAC.1